MRLKELSLWFLFLITCFSAGYLKGYIPEDSWPELWGSNPEVEILLHNEVLLPDSVRQELQKKLKIQIKTLLVEDRQAFTIRTITSPGYHLAIIPNHWIDPAVKANQMSNLNPLRTLIEKSISADFLKRTDDKIYAVPIFWLATHLIRTSNESIKSWYLLKDWDYIFDKMTVLNLDEKTIKPWPFFESLPDQKNNLSSVIEVSHIVEKTTDNSNFHTFEKDLRSLYVWSLSTPRHSPSRKMTLKLIETLIQSSTQKKIITDLELATTLTELNQSELPRFKKASYVRELDLSKLKTPDWLGLEQIIVLKNEFSN